MANYCKEHGIYCEVATDLGFCSVTGCTKRNQVSNTNTEHNEVYETIKRGLEDAVNGRVTEYAPIVRCKDCKFWHEVDTMNVLRYGECDRLYSAIRQDCFVNENWFCADGERKEQNDEE